MPRSAFDQDYTGHIISIAMEFRRKAARAIVQYELNKRNAAHSIRPDVLKQSETHEREQAGR